MTIKQLTSIIFSKNSRPGLISILVLLYLLRLVIPYGNYLLFPYEFFMVLYAGYVLLTDVNRLKLIRGIVKPLTIPLLLLAIQLFYYSLDSVHHRVLTIDILHSINTFVVFGIITVIFNTSDGLSVLFGYLSKQIVVVATVVSVLGLMKLILFSLGFKIPFLDVAGYPEGSSLTLDNNFFSLFILLGVVLLIPKLQVKQSLKKRLLLQLLLILFYGVVALSISRRGMVMLIVIFCGFIVYSLFLFFSKKNNGRYFFQNIRIFIIGTVLLIVSFLFFLFGTTPLIRNNIVSNYSLSNYFREFVTALVYNSSSMYKDSISYSEVRNQLWVGESDPKDPQSGWGINCFPVKINKVSNYKIVPKGSVGCLIDSRCKALPWRDNAYISLIPFRGITSENKNYISSVYCYVSDDFNGDAVSISSRLNGGQFVSYDLSEKGKWKKLTTYFKGKEQDYNIWLQVAKYKTSSFDSLQGHVIFAYPELDSMLFEPKNPKSWTQNPYKEMLPLVGENVSIVPDSTIGLLIDSSCSSSTNNSFVSSVYSYETIKGKRYISSIYCYVSENFNGEKVGISSLGKISYYNIKAKGRWQKVYINAEGSGNTTDTRIFFELPDTISLREQKGQVVFAHPELDSLFFDAKNPKSWSQNSFIEEYPLTGRNVSIVPVGSIGLRVDCDGNILTNSTFFNPVQAFNTTIGKRYQTSIYCYVSSDFNGTNVGISSSRQYAFYNLKAKGQWQKINLNLNGNGRKVSSNLFFNFSDEMSIDKLKGYVIYAYPDVDTLLYTPRIVNRYAPNDKYSVISELQGTNVDIVPKGTQGIKFDKNSNGRIWETIYYSSYSINTVNTEAGDSVKVSMYCYQSSDFNGISRVQAQGKKGVILKDCRYYDRKKIGQWQKLESKVISKGGNYSINIFFSKRNSKDYSELTGYVVFAYPEIFVKRNGRWLSYERLKGIEKEEFYKEEIKSFNTKKEKAGTLVNGEEEKPVINTEGIIKRIDSEDVEEFKRSKSVFSGPRTDRWRYAWLLFSKDYSWRQRIFGGGFGYTDKFAKLFGHPYGFDYPHNPLLSVLLYSGIIGLILYIWMLFIVFKYYWRYRKEHWKWLLCFIVAFFFSFFSANGPFEPAVLGFFILLPFAIHMISSKRIDVKK